MLKFIHSLRGEKTRDKPPSFANGVCPESSRWVIAMGDGKRGRRREEEINHSEFLEI